MTVTVLVPVGTAKDGVGWVDTSRGLLIGVAFFVFLGELVFLAIL
jgi:hypothetical protein